MDSRSAVGAATLKQQHPQGDRRQAGDDEQPGLPPAERPPGLQQYQHCRHDDHRVGQHHHLARGQYHQQDGGHGQGHAEAHSAEDERSQQQRRQDDSELPTEEHQGRLNSPSWAARRRVRWTSTTGGPFRASTISAVSSGVSVSERSPSRATVQ